MLIAVDTNVLMDLAAAVESVVDAVELVRRRMVGTRLIVLPTVIQELRYIAKWGETDEHVRLAVTALQQLTGGASSRSTSSRGNSASPNKSVASSVSLGCCRRRKSTTRSSSVAFILAEAALLGCGLFLISDAHFAILDFQLLTLELKASDVSVPAIASPREILRKFYR